MDKDTAIDLASRNLLNAQTWLALGPIVVHYTTPFHAIKECVTVAFDALQAATRKPTAQTRPITTEQARERVAALEDTFRRLIREFETDTKLLVDSISIKRAITLDGTGFITGLTARVEAPALRRDPRR